VLRHTCALSVLQGTGDIRQVALWLGHESTQTTEDYLRVDVTQRIGVLTAVTPPQLRPGAFRPPDALIASLGREDYAKSSRPARRSTLRRAACDFA